MRLNQNRHKYNAKPTVYNGVKYASKGEASYASKLDLLVRSGEIVSWVRQIKFDLPGNTKHYVDFMLIYPNQRVEFHEYKGRDLQAGKMKRRMVEDIYKIKIKVVKGK